MVDSGDRATRRESKLPVMPATRPPTPRFPKVAPECYCAAVPRPSLLPPRPRELRVACDSLVALSGATAGGQAIFAKNSDRPAFECQPLLQVPAASHAPHSRVRCTYIDVPQSRVTHRVLGSRPYWCWGFEHGLNEHRVAIGNHTVFTKAEVTGTGLIGMDLVRLGLERSTNRNEAIATITGLLEQFGQGGSGYADKQWPYHNSFLIADPEGAWVLETSDRQWACRAVTEAAALSNHLSIGSDWDQLSHDAVEHACRSGWWKGESRFDFAGAYRDTAMAPEVISSGRHRRSCALLAEARGAITTATVATALRDHYGTISPRLDLTPLDETYFSLCMHADPVGTTTASMIATLPRDRSKPLIYRASLGSPCVGAFVPLLVAGDIPAALTRGGLEPDDSPWWTMKRLLQWVEVDWSHRHAAVRQEMDELEERFGVAETTAPGAAAPMMDEALTAVLAVARKFIAS